MRVRIAYRTAALVAALLTPPLAMADDPTARGFDPDPHRYAVGLDADFMVETARVQPKGSLRGELLVDYVHGLLAVSNGGTRGPNILDARVSLHGLVSYSLGRLELGLDIPFVARQWPSLTPLTSAGVTGPLVAPIANTTFGDVRLAGKVALLDERSRPLGLAALLEMRLPTGDKQAFTSDGLAAVPGVVATRHFGPVRVNAQLGYLFRKSGQYLQLVATDGLTFGLGGSLALPPLLRVREWRAIAELTGQWPRGNVTTDRYRMPLSARIGLRARLWRNLGLDFGLGTGLGEAGYGREGYRIFTGVRWDDLKPKLEPQAVPGDRDGDGIPDAEDRCPDEPGPKELEGCPDRDSDGIPDIDDKCPDEPGPAQNDGCPGEPKVEIETERLSLKDAISFDFGRDVIRPESFPILDQVAAILQSHPELKRIRIEGHTDNVGSAAYNRDLSQRRAASVVRYLAGKGVGQNRLVAQGYGYDKPVASNATALGRAKNRRVEFTILEESGADVKPDVKGESSRK